MKTQIALRIILVAVALIFSINNNNGSFKQPAYAFSKNSKISASSSSSHQENKTVAHNNENNVPYLPQPAHEHDFDCFDFKHHEVRSFWRCLANKAFAILYNIIILLPIVIESLKQVLS